MIISPYSDAKNFLPGGPLAPTAENFPCMKSFLPMLAVGADPVIRDVVSGASAVFTGGTGDAQGVIGIGSATLPVAPGMFNSSGHLLALFAVTFAPPQGGLSVRLQSPGGTPSGLIIDATACKVHGSSSEASLGAMTRNMSASGEAVIYRPGSTGQGQKMTQIPAALTAGALTDTAPSPVTSINFPAGSTLTVETTGFAAMFYGIAVFGFLNGRPSAQQLQNGFGWMQQQWANGIPSLPVATYGKLIYPGWKGAA